MSRVVVDANVYLSALMRTEGPPGQIVKGLLGKGHTRSLFPGSSYFQR